MDWPLAIERNRSQLLRIVAELLALAGLSAGGSVEVLPRAVRNTILRILRPAESAVRRLIMIAAHGLVLESSPPSQRAGGGRAASPASPPRKSASPRFQLFDTRKRFDFNRRRYLKPGQGPRITFFDDDPSDPRVPFLRPPVIRTIEVNPARPLTEAVPAASLCRRLAAISAALADIPKQALRLAKWRIRRAAMTRAKFRDPGRPGHPPGHRARRTHEVDDVLKECRRLARERVRADTS